MADPKPKSALDPDSYVEDLIAEWQIMPTEDEEFCHVELLTEAEEELRRLRKALAESTGAGQ